MKKELIFSKFITRILLVSGITLITVCLFIAFDFGYFNFKKKTNREDYEKFINSHVNSIRDKAKEKESDSGKKTDRPDLAYEQDFLMTLDPALGYPTKEKLIPIIEKVRKINQLKVGIPGDASNNWVERGPNNVGGRVRALLFDPNDPNNKKVWAGSVSGGLWYNNDITDANSKWLAVDDFWANIAVSSIAYDPGNKSIFYVGTGEGWFNSDAVRGAGIWKSLDGGQTWKRLENTASNDFRTVQKIKVLASGRLVVAASSGILISDDGGVSWKMKTTGFASDLEIATDGILYAGKGRVNMSGSVLKSIDNGDTWLDITPSGLSQERVELATAPSNDSVIYAVASKGDNVSWIRRSKDKGLSWDSISTPKYMTSNCSESIIEDFARGQAWYNLILAVHPTDPNIVIAGGIDLSKSSDGGKTWKTISYWTGACFSYVHADQHAIAFRPGKNNEIVVTNDGGVSYSANAINLARPVFEDRNNGLNITQYYSCAIHPDAFKNYYLGGCQDNGTHKFETIGINSGKPVSGGDGGFCFIDQKNPEIQLSSYVNNNFYLSRDAGITFNNLLSQEDGSFINPADYDNNLHVLYSAKSTTSINRISNLNEQPKFGSITISSLGTMASHIKVSKYTINSSTIFVGTQAGRLFKVTGAENNSSVATEITGNLPTGNISCVDIGKDENELLVTYSNYGVNSVWYTNDAGKNWSSKEGDLPDMPVRWVLFNPNNGNQVILATELGVWSTLNFNVQSPAWSPSSSGLANVRVDMLKLRESDFEVIAATHGRGIFTSDAFSTIDKNALAAYFSIKGSPNIGVGETVQFEDLSKGSPTAYNWVFEGGTPANSTNPNPVVSYSTPGIYKVTQNVSKGSDTKSLTKNEYVRVGQDNSWKEQSTGFATASRGIDYIDLVDNMVVWAIAYDGANANNKIKEFTKTINGGQLWTPGIIDIPGDIAPAMVCALSKDTAWIPMYPNTPGAGGGIYFTNNGGLSWTKQESATFSGKDAFPNVVHFWNKNEGFCMGDPNNGYFEIYTTTNGGNDWTRVPQSKIPAMAADEAATVGQFSVTDDGAVFFNTTKGRIFKSKDKGATWSLIITPLRAYNKIAFSSENNGIIIESGDNINTFKLYYTLNSGTNWTQTSNTNVFSGYIEYVPGTSRMFISSGSANGRSGASYSIDGGVSWTKYPGIENTQCLALDFYDMTLGWIGQFNASKTEGGIIRFSGLPTIPDFSISPEIAFIEAPVVFTDNTLSIETSKSYVWAFGENASPAKSNAIGPHSVNYSAKGNKNVTLTVNGKLVSKVFNISITGIEKVSDNAVFEVYPNPSSGIFNLKLDIKRVIDLNIKIYKLNGQIVYSNLIKSATLPISLPLDLSKSGKGIYMIKINGGSYNETRKILIR